MGSAQALKLSEAHTLEALNIGIASCLALNVTRVGDLSMWKGCAYANASRNAIFAVSLAQRGMTGPSPVFEGTDGYFKVVSHGPFELEPFGGNGQPFKIMESNVKRFPLGQYSQTVVQAALEVRDQMPDPADIEEVNIKTLQTAVTIMAGDPEKWHPTNRETADHSMPYTAAVALMFGDIGLQQFEDEYLGNRQLQDLVGKVNVHAWEEANRREPEAMLCSLEVVTKSGQRYASEVPYHRGHWKNPMSDAEVEAKFRGQAEGLLSPANTDALLDHLWNLERAENLGEVFRLMRIDS
jgi:2-methylcitrate dehydratase